jgi:MFS family permease
MATRNETTVVYAAGVVQGIALVTFPAASTIFTDPAEYDLTSTQYGALFLPQVVAAIVAALLGARLSGRFDIKRVYLAGLAAGLLSMALLVASSFLTGEEEAAYALLLLATASLGAGFGLTVPALNTFAAAFHPGPSTARFSRSTPCSGSEPSSPRSSWRSSSAWDPGWDCRWSRLPSSRRSSS